MRDRALSRSLVRAPLDAVSPAICLLDLSAERRAACSVVQSPFLATSRIDVNVGRRSPSSSPVFLDLGAFITVSTVVPALPVSHRQFHSVSPLSDARRLERAVAMSDSFESALRSPDGTFQGPSGRIPKSFLPFDGSCRCSSNSDLTLMFNDGSSLKTHLKLLRIASLVLGSILQCRENNALLLDKTTKDAWIVVLNEIHPKSLESITDLSTFDLGLLVTPSSLEQDLKMNTVQEDVLEQGRKYQIDRVMLRVDTFLCGLIKELDCEAIRKHHAKTQPAPTLTRLIFSFDLPRSKYKLLEFTVQMFRGRRKPSRGYRYGHCTQCGVRSGDDPCQECARLRGFLTDLLSHISEQDVRELFMDMVVEHFC